MSDREISLVYKDEDFEVLKEVYGGVCFYHCYANQFNKSVLKKMREVWEGIKEESLLEGWSAIHSYTPNPKFAMLLPGAKKIDEFETEGVDYEVIRWELQR